MNSGDMTATDDIMINQFESLATPRGFKESILKQFANDRHNVFDHDDSNDCSNIPSVERTRRSEQREHVYDQVTLAHVPAHVPVNADHNNGFDDAEVYEHINSSENVQENQRSNEDHGQDQGDIYATVIKNHHSPRNSNRYQPRDETLYSTEESTPPNITQKDPYAKFGDQMFSSSSQYGADVSSNRNELEESRSSIGSVKPKTTPFWERTKKEESPVDVISPVKSAKQIWMERNNAVTSSSANKNNLTATKNRQGLSKYHQKGSSVTNEPSTSPKKVSSVRDFWKAQASSGGHTTVADITPAVVSTLPADKFAAESLNESNEQELSVSIEAMFDLDDDDDDNTGGVSQSIAGEQESFADILRKQMMF